MHEAARNRAYAEAFERAHKERAAIFNGLLGRLTGRR